jgi:FSR family fosmidomycin resistance protein-like MFS transporter
VVFLGFSTFLPMYWQYRFDTATEVGSIILALYCICGAISNLIGGYISDRIGPVRTVQWGHIIAVPFMILFTLQTNPYIAALLLLPLALSLYASFSSMVLLGQIYLAKNMGFASGITLGVALSFGGMFTPIIGWVADHHGGLSMAMVMVTGAAIFAALSSLVLKKVK